MKWPAVVVVSALLAAASAAAAPGPLSVSADRTRVVARLGNSFVFHSTMQTAGTSGRPASSPI